MRALRGLLLALMGCLVLPCVWGCDSVAQQRDPVGGDGVVAGDDDDVVGDDDDLVGDDDDTVGDDDDTAVAGVLAENKPCDAQGSTLVDDLDLELPEDIEAFCDAGHAIVDGDVTIHRTRLLNLDGLECLCQVNGDVAITSNAMLYDIDGLQGLKYVLGGFEISEDSGLIDADGLVRLRLVSGDFTISNVSAIGGPADGELVGFGQLNVVGGSFTIERASSIVHITGFGGLQSVGDDFTLDENSALAAATGFVSLHTVGQDVVITDNPAFPTADAEALALGIATVGGAVDVSGNGP